MVIIKENGKSDSSVWKALQLNQTVVSNGIEGLIGIEELTNYTLIQNKRKRRISAKGLYAQPLIKTIKVNVREKTKLVGNGKKPSESPSESDPLIKKKKKRNPNRSKNKRKKSAVDTLEEPLNVEVATIASSLSGTEKTLVKKKQKRNPNRSKNKRKKSAVDTVEEPLNVDVASIASSLSGTEKTLAKKKAIRKLKQNLEKKNAISKNAVTGNPLIKKALSSSEKLTGKSSKRKKKIKASKDKKGKLAVSNTGSPNDANAIKSDGSVLTNSNTITQVKMSKKDKKRMNKLKPQAEIIPETNENDGSEVEETDEEQSEGERTMRPVKNMEGWSGLNLPQSILRALSEKGFKKPTEIQALSLPAALLGRRDIMGAAETGSGKTLAFGLPIIYGILQQKNRDANASESTNLDNEEHIVNKEIDETMETEEFEPEILDSENESEDLNLDNNGIGCVQVINNIDFDDVSVDERRDVVTKPVNPLYNQKLYALILTPTRELAIQVKDHLVAAAKYTGIRVAVVIGGLAPQKQERLLRTKPEIVVATPGRLWELIQDGNPHLQQVDDISFLAIDETDRMIEKGHFQELQELLLRINTNEEKKKRRQNFVFSATLTMVHEPPPRKGKKKQMRVTPGQKLQDLIKMLGISHPKVVDVTNKSGTAETLEEAQIRCSFDEKDIYLYYFLIRHPGRTLIFCNSISCVRRLAQLLTILKCKPVPIHASMVQRQRLRNLDKFRDNPTGLLLATDVAARGLDIPDVQHVIHYQVPRTSEGYVHRSGRTARASKQGLTLLLIEPNEQPAYSRLCRNLGRDQKLPPFKVSEDLLMAAKQRVQLARDIDQLELTSRRSDADLGWFQKALTDMDMMLDKDDLPMSISEKETKANRKIAVAQRKQLELLLSRPLFSSRR